MTDIPDSNSGSSEERFMAQNEKLMNLYDLSHDDLSQEECVQLQPILNSLGEERERYEELELIAEGAEKRITLVYDRRLNRQVAMARGIKADTPQEQEQFLREAHIEANLSHPNILQVYNMGLDVDGIPFFTMELIRGENLKYILEQLRQGDPEYKKRYTLDRLISIFSKVCDAISYAHSRNVLHLDLKPENIRVGTYGEVFVCDWGLSVIMNSGDPTTLEKPGLLDGDMLNDMTLTGIIKGTPGYMAPEQTVASGEKNIRTDVYALGAILYTILTYQKPVDGTSANEMLENTRKGRIMVPQLRAKDRKLPHSLCAIAMKALAFQPEDRYADVAALSADVTRYVSGYPASAEKAGPLLLFSLLLKRHNRMTMLLLLFMLLLAIVVSVNMISVKREQRIAVVAREEAETNLALFKAQQEETIRLDTTLTESIRYVVYDPTLSTSEMLKMLEIGVGKEMPASEKRNLLLYKGNLHFVLQQFNAAAKSFEQVGKLGGKYRVLADFSRKFAQMKPDDSKLFTPAQLAEAIAQSKRSMRSMYYLYHHHLQQQGVFEPEEYLPVLKAMLDHINDSNPPSFPKLVLKKRPEGYHLDLSGSDYYVYTLSEIGYYKENLLAPLNLHSLDISHTPLVDPSQLNGLNVEELTMKGVALSRNGLLLSTCRANAIRRLEFSAGDYSPKVIESFREHFEVVESDN